MKLTKKQRAAFMRAAEDCFLYGNKSADLAYTDEPHYFSCNAIRAFGGDALVERYSLYLSEDERDVGFGFYDDHSFQCPEKRQLARSLMLLMVMEAES